MAYANLFKNSAQASAYALYRPTYTEPLFQAILHYAGIGRGYKGKLAVDVATGSGQALQGLEGYFEALIGIDASLDQINNAVQLPNLTYRQGDAHKLPLEDQSADLVTVAQALHWFDRPKFYKEAGRVLNDDGVLAVWTYDAGQIAPDDGPVNKVYLDMLNTVMGPYWAGPRIFIDNHYRDIEPLAPDYFMESKRLEFTLSTTLSVDDLVGYVQSWSAYATAKKDHPELPDPIIAFRERLEKAHAEQGSPTVMAINRIMTLIMGKRPVRK